MTGDRSGRRDLWPIAGAAAGAVFVLLAICVVALGGLPFDDPVAAFVQGLPIAPGTWETLTSLGGGLVLLVVGVAMGLAALATGRLRLVLVIALVLIGASLFTTVVKQVVERPRPPGVHLVAAAGFSFPSGHSLNSAASYGLLAVLAWRARLPAILRGLALVAGLAVPFVVGLSRIALGVHYPSDVLGGWSAGLAFVAAGAIAITRLGAMDRDVRRARPEG